jgi:bifunctional DNA-binding transcriptional regulator/antitoxin component of YhaV-PrlF toxin-antitoxin module
MVEPLIVPASRFSVPATPMTGQRAGRVPLPELPLVPAPARWAYAISRIDASGRLTEQSMVRVLGWSSGDRYTMTSRGIETVVIRRDPDGAVELADRSRIKVPAPLRARCRIRTGDRVFLAASKPMDTLLVYPMTTLGRLLISDNEALATGSRP